MADILGFEVDTPSFGFGGGTGGISWMIILAIIIFFLVAGITFYMVYLFRIYNRKIIVFENISGQGFQPIYKDRARLVKMADGKCGCIGRI